MPPLSPPAATTVPAGQAGRIAHDLNGAMAVIDVYAFLASQRSNTTDEMAELADFCTALLRVKALIAELMTIVRPS